MIIRAGARSYIGTLWSVGNETAMRAPKAFYDDFVQQGNLLSAFFAMNKTIINKQYENVYIFWGLHLSTLPKVSVKSDTKIFDDLIGLYLSWLKKIESFDPTKLEEEERASHEAVDEFSRGVTEIELGLGMSS